VPVFSPSEQEAAFEHAQHEQLAPAPLGDSSEAANAESPGRE